LQAIFKFDRKKEEKRRVRTIFQSLNSPLSSFFD
jgi:hypothetical protein